MNSREKGKRAERQLAANLREYGYDTRRGQQYNGADGSADVVGLPGVHIECKHVEHLNIDDAMDQARRDALPGEIPAVFHRKNRTQWKVTMLFDDFMTLYREWEAGNELQMGERDIPTTTTAATKTKEEARDTDI